jgi:hypothetical protein
MEIKKLWDILEPLEGSIQNLKEDYKRGKAPHLPYFIIDQENVKRDIKSKIKHIDGEYLQKTFVIGNYGNGKTNLLKYLELFCKDNGRIGDSEIISSYKRTDIDKPDIFLTLLSHLEFKFKNYLLDSIVKINKKSEPLQIYKELLNDFENFESIKQYVEVISKTNDEKQIEELIYLGTGRLYTMHHWNRFELRKLNDFDRREIFVLFLNILSFNKIYIIFGIDELEKMREKSKIRFRNFLTSFRELLDFSTFIKGHLVIVAMTSDTNNYQNILRENDAFYSRIVKDIQVLDAIPINNKNFQEELIYNLAELFEEDVKDRVNEIFSKAKRKFRTKLLLDNRKLVSEYVAEILNTDSLVNLFNLVKELKTLDLNELFLEKKDELEKYNRFKDISNKIFEPLRYYLEKEGFTRVGDNLKIQERSLIIPEESKLIIWNFTKSTFEKDVERALSYKNQYQRVIIMQSATYDIESVKYKDIVIKDFYAKDLLVLLELYEENSNHSDKISDLIVGLLDGAL